ncbi:hypothetical protein QFC21_002483 [Naganishia friedmannii]|uniref:Uncharacterized protein n=1 Tax=Naganishia friedmannii TaxID=89922 RepID=A0ACC2VWR3_9TREE|nr:hypothetical protein QFC21_002483 [Naganishia friedmannii]
MSEHHQTTTPTAASPQVGSLQPDAEVVLLTSPTVPVLDLCRNFAGDSVNTGTSPVPNASAPISTPMTAAFSNSYVIDASDSSPGAITDIFKAFDHPYSPSDSQYVYEGDWLDFMDFSLFPEDPIPAVSASNCVVIETPPAISSSTLTSVLNDPAQPAVDFFSDEWQAFFQSNDYLAWYEQELARGTFDHLVYDDGGSNPSPSVNPALLHAETSSQTVIHSVENKPFAHYDSESSESDSSTTDDDDDDEERAVFNKSFTGDDHPDADSDGVRLAVTCSKSLTDPEMQPLSPMRVPFLNTTDLNDLAVLETLAAESDASGVDSSSDGEEDIRPELDATAIERHYWHRADVKYTFSHDGRKYYMTPEHMHVRFRGVPYSVTKYWEAKRPGSISSFRIMEYFAARGHLGPFREPMYHLLPRRLYRELMEDKENFFF